MESVIRVRMFPAWSFIYYLIQGIKAAAVNMATVIPLNRADTAKENVNRKAEKYLKQHGSSILRMAYSYVHNMADSEDILQETLIKVLEANPVFESETHEKAYLLKTAANLAKNKIDYNKRHETDELNKELVAEDREDLSFVWEAVKKLPDTAREVTHLFYQEGYQISEISEILGRKESTVRSDLKRARERLKEILKEEYDFG